MGGRKQRGVGKMEAFLNANAVMQLAKATGMRAGKREESTTVSSNTGEP